MRPIAATLLRDNEIQRIEDNLIRVGRIEEVLQKHKEYLDAERYQFMKTKSFSFIKERKRRQELRSEEKNNRKQFGEQNEIMEMSEKENHQSTKNDTKKEEKINILAHFREIGRNLNDYNVENEIKDLIRKQFIEVDHDI